MSKSEEETDAMLLDAYELSTRIRPMLAGHGATVQGAVLADLLSFWIAGHHPKIRDEALRLHYEHVRELVPISEKEIFGDDGFPSA